MRLRRSPKIVQPATASTPFEKGYALEARGMYAPACYEYQTALLGYSEMPGGMPVDSLLALTGAWRCYRGAGRIDDAEVLHPALGNLARQIQSDPQLVSDLHARVFSVLPPEMGKTFEEFYPR